MGSFRPRRIVLAVCPYEGEVVDRVVHAHYKPKAIKYMPLGLLSLAACLRDHEVTIIDAASRGLTVEETVQAIEAAKPEILGLSAVTYRAWAMREILRKTSAPIKVVGGPHATYYHDEILRQGADAVFVGDAEHSFPEWIRQGCPMGLFRSAPVDLDTLPLPARDMINIADYRILDTEGLLFNAGNLRLPMFSSKGCPLRCTYCDVQQKQYFTKSPARIIDEFRFLKNEVGATSIHILDDAFNIRKDRVVEFCELLQESGIETDWSVRGVVEIKEHVVKALAEAGCKRFHVGIEHLDDNVLGYFRKSHRYEHIQAFCELCAKYGITVLAYFIIGAPPETARYRERLPEMIRSLGIRIPYFNVLTPLSQTPFYQQLIDNGTFKTDIWGQFAADPVRHFVIPNFRSPDEEREIQAARESLIAAFTETRAPDSTIAA